jgi:Ser/Thr protein kinase RdoA (MazF antagonist)
VGFTDDIKTLGDLARRFEQYRLQAERDKAELRKEVAGLKAELAKKQGRAPQRIHGDCQHCIYRLQALKNLDESSG